MKITRIALAAAIAVGSLSLVSSASAEGDKTIAEIASSDPQFSTLVAALTAADLVSPFDACDDAKTTVLAPTNDAFAAALTALGMTAEQLLADKALLTSVLTYHVIAGEVPAATVVGLTEATTLNGQKIKIAVVNGGVVLNDKIKVTATDIKACNGIIHVIDGVLVPAAATTMPATGSDSTGMFVLAGSLLALGAGGVVISRRRRPTAA